jgi:hypothetical protein
MVYVGSLDRVCLLHSVVWGVAFGYLGSFGVASAGVGQALSTHFSRKRTACASSLRSSCFLDLSAMSWDRQRSGMSK